MARRRRRTNGTQREAAATAPAVPSFRPRGDQVLVRMYGQGLGDCFLLAFPRTRATDRDEVADPDRPVYVLIDCGVVAGTPGGPTSMRQIVADIRATTRDEATVGDDGEADGHLDLLIVTHEHWDHLSGFVQAADAWQRIRVDALWTAWTERDDPGGLPDVLKKMLQKQRAALALVSDRALRFGLDDRHGTTLGLMSFVSDAAADGIAFAAAPTVGDAFDAAKGLVAAEHHRCCEPGEVHAVPGTDAVAYVLGPPRDDDRLRQLDPSRRAPETFGAGHDFSLRRLAEGRSGFNAFSTSLLGPVFAAGDPASPDVAAEQLLAEQSFPFDRAYRVALPVAEDAAEREPGTFPALAAYFDEVNHWRRIDFDWLGAADAFALQADHLTNNTSLVLAFELPPAERGAERKVLLFVGDAQVGNWLSWDEISAWSPQGRAKPAQAKPDVADLLRRAVFYKVGHHGSHNATLKAKGVERMPDDGTLTAFVPASPDVARKVKDWCEMPLDSLLDALAERTGGRVVLPNGGVWPPVPDDELARARARIGVEVATAALPAKVRDRDDELVEDEVPLWVQVAIDY